VLGPTCSWKSDVAVLLAEALDAEILSCDAMQVYRGMDIGVAKPPPEVRARVPHHLIDTREIHEPYDAHQFVNDAKAVLQELQRRERRAVLAGGTGFYARALIYGYRMLPADAALYKQLSSEYDAPGGAANLRRELTQADPGAPASRLASLDRRRLLRAVEVLRLQGSPPWLLHTHAVAPSDDFEQVIILPSLQVLRPRIASRTRQMIRAGWLAETEALLGKGLLDTPTARQALGYKEIAEHLAGPKPDIDRLVERIVQRTVGYARRQRTWFRNQHPGARVIEVEAPTKAARLAGMILSRAQLPHKLLTGEA